MQRRESCSAQSGHTFLTLKQNSQWSSITGRIKYLKCQWKGGHSFVYYPLVLFVSLSKTSLSDMCHHVNLLGIEAWLIFPVTQRRLCCCESSLLILSHPFSNCHVCLSLYFFPAVSCSSNILFCVCIMLSLKFLELDFKAVAFYNLYL